MWEKVGLAVFVVLLLGLVAGLVITKKVWVFGLKNSGVSLSSSGKPERLVRAVQPGELVIKGPIVINFSSKFPEKKSLIITQELGQKFNNLALGCNWRLDPVLGKVMMLNVYVDAGVYESFVQEGERQVLFNRGVAHCIAKAVFDTRGLKPDANLGEVLVKRMSELTVDETFILN